MRQNRIRQAGAAGRCATLGWLSVSRGFTAEVMARQGFDALCVDLQHGTAEMQDVLPMLQAISQTDTVPAVRVAWNEPAAIMKALDLGAVCVIVPLVNNAAEAAMAVATCRSPPAGMRSSGPVRARHYGGPDCQAKANDEILGRAMIETRGASRTWMPLCQARPRRGPYRPGRPVVRTRPGATRRQPRPAPSRHLRPDPRHGHRHGIKCVMRCAGAAFAGGVARRGFDMAMLTSDLSCMIAGTRMELDAFTAAAG